MQTVNNELKHFETFFKTQPFVEYKKGERVVRPAELETHALYIKSGFLKIYHESQAGKEIIINIINASQYDYLIFGLAPYIQEYSIEALTDIHAKRFSKDEFVAFIKNHPETFPALLSPLSRCLRSVYNQMKWLKNGNASSKIASIIHYLGKESDGKGKNTVAVGFRITHQMIANLTGLTRETVTVQLNRLRDKGLIEYHDNILIINNMKELSHQREV